MRRFAVGLILALSFSPVSICGAALFTYSASDRPGVNPDANAGAANVWLVTLTSGDGSQNGDFIANSANNGFPSSGAGAGNPAWAMYANSGQTARSTTVAMSTLTGGATTSLSLAGQSISLDFDNGFITTGNQVGVNFVDSGGNTQLTFRFVGGGTSYEVIDSSGTVGIGKPFTADGFNLKLSLNDSVGAYTLDAGGTIRTGTLQQPSSSSLASLNVFNANAAGGAPSNEGPRHDLYFNNLAISTTAIPEVSPALGIPVAVLLAGFGARVHRLWRQGTSSQR